MGKKRNNSAGRLLGILDAAWHQSEKHKIIDAWRKVLGLADLKDQEASFRITDSLSLLRAEIDLVEAEMRTIEVNPDLYEPYLKRSRNALNISNLQSSWGAPRGQLREDTLLSLKLCAELCEDEASELSDEELEEILQQVQNLRENLSDSKLSASVIGRLEKHLDLISRTIQQVPIVGPNALRDGFRAGVAELLEDEEVLGAAVNEPEVKSTIGIWGRVKEVGGKVVDTDKMTTAILNMYEKGEKLGGFLKALSGGG